MAGRMGVLEPGPEKWYSFPPETSQLLLEVGGPSDVGPVLESPGKGLWRPLSFWLSLYSRSYQLAPKRPRLRAQEKERATKTR